MKQAMWVITGFVALSCIGCTSVQKCTLEQLPQPKEDKGLVYFYRDKSFVGSGVSYYVCENGEKIGALQNGTFFFVEPEPGVHVYTAKTESTDSVTLEVEQAKTYYVKGEVDMGFWVGRPDLSVVHELEGKAEIPNLQYIMLKQKGDDSDE